MAKNIKISATRISSFLSCKQKYWFSYHEKLPKVSNPAFKLGTTVHETLEFAGHIWLDKVKKGGDESSMSFTKAEIKKIMKEYDALSVREGIEDLGVHIEGKALVKRRLADFISGEKLLGLETKFGFWGKDAGPSIKTKDGVPLMGAIDKVEQYDEDTLLIIDYKTSKTAPTADQLRVDPQLSIYNLVAKTLYPQYKRVVLALDLLKSGMAFTYRTDEEMEEFEAYLKVVYDQMLALKPEDVKASLNIFCPWCDYKDYCSTYQRACKKADYNFLPTMHYEDEQLVEEWKSVRATKKILEQRDRELSMILTEKIKRSGEDMEGETETIYIRQNSRTNFDLQTVAQTVPVEDFPSLVNVNKRAVENYMQDNPAVKEPILASANTNYTTPFLATKKKKLAKKKK